MTLADGFLLMFVYLKLTGQITWGWGWVLSPLWVAFTVGTIAEYFKQRALKKIQSATARAAGRFV